MFCSSEVIVEMRRGGDEKGRRHGVVKREVHGLVRREVHQQRALRWYGARIGWYEGPGGVRDRVL